MLPSAPPGAHRSSLFNGSVPAEAPCLHQHPTADRPASRPCGKPSTLRTPENHICNCKKKKKNDITAFELSEQALSLLSPFSLCTQVCTHLRQALIRIFWASVAGGLRAGSLFQGLPLVLWRDCWIIKVSADGVVLSGHLSRSHTPCLGAAQETSANCLLLASCSLPLNTSHRLPSLPFPPYSFPPSFIFCFFLPRSFPSSSSLVQGPLPARELLEPVQDRRCAWTTQCGKALQYERVKVSRCPGASYPHR